jgi:hypothetical protein
VDRFLKFAAENPSLEFIVTPVGCGLAGYSADKIAPLFSDRTANVILPSEFALD